MFAPVVPLGGYTGFRFLERTYTKQLDALSKSPEIVRNIEYFLANAAKPQSAEEFVQDRRLMQVALGAFGLDDEIDKRALVRRILEEGVIESRSFANRLNDKAYQDLALEIGFAEGGSFLKLESRRDEIAERYRIRQFERAVGEVDVDMRLALNFRREITALAGQGLSSSAGWFRVLGSQPLRQVIEGAFNLPSEFAQLDVDAQRELLEEKTAARYDGKSVAVFSDPEAVDDALRRFFLNAQIKAGQQPYSPGATALALLQSVPLGAAGSSNLFSSNF